MVRRELDENQRRGDDPMFHQKISSLGDAVDGRIRRMPPHLQRAIATRWNYLKHRFSQPQSGLAMLVFIQEYAERVSIDYYKNCTASMFVEYR